MPYVASTLSCDQFYTEWNRPVSSGAKIARPATPFKQVFISGRANVQNKISTPEGVITKISDEDAEFLKQNPAFQGHEKNGHVKIIRSAVDPVKVARDMKDRDDSAPLNANKGDFEKGGRAAGVAPKNSKIE